MAIFKKLASRLTGGGLQSAWDKALTQNWPTAIQQYLDAGPAKASELSKAPCLALDFETDGLDAKSDAILSAGFVALEAGSIQGATAEHWIARADGARNAKTVAVHGLTDTAVQDGVDLSYLVDRLFEALAGRVMLAHHAVIEVSFLKRVCLELYGNCPPLLALDTLRIEQSRPGAPRSMRLLDLRTQYGLPSYQNHHALSDAHACGELFLAQLAHSGLGAEPFSRYVTVAT